MLVLDTKFKAKLKLEFSENQDKWKINLDAGKTIKCNLLKSCPIDFHKSTTFKLVPYRLLFGQ